LRRQNLEVPSAPHFSTSVIVVLTPSPLFSTSAHFFNVRALCGKFSDGQAMAELVVSQLVCELQRAQLELRTYILGRDSGNELDVQVRRLLLRVENRKAAI
jgi:hypothetical protein